MDFVKPTRSGVSQIINQETGISLDKVNNDTDLSPYAHRIANKCVLRFGVMIDVSLDNLTARDLFRQLGIKDL